MADEGRAPRRRRSVARSPALVAPADIPEDAAGRVAFIAVRTPEDRLAPPVVAEATRSAAPQPQLPPWVSEWGGWIAVGVLAVLLVIVFLIGWRFTK